MGSLKKKCHLPGAAAFVVGCLGAAPPRRGTATAGTGHNIVVLYILSGNKHRVEIKIIA